MTKPTLARIVVVLEHVPRDGFEAWCAANDASYCGARAWWHGREWVYPGWVVARFHGQELGCWPLESFDSDEPVAR